VYAIVKSGGRQIRVEEKEIIEVDHLQGHDEGSEVEFDVLLVHTDEGTKVGTPFVKDARVVGKVLEHFRGEKIEGFTYQPKKHTQRHFGHRQFLTRVEIQKIEVGK